MGELMDLMVKYYSEKYAEQLTQPSLFAEMLPKKDGSDWYKPILRYGHKGETVEFKTEKQMRVEVTGALETTGLK